MTQGETIREARIAARMTQEHLAKSARVSEKTVRRAERNERISAENARALCACLNLDSTTLPQPESAGPVAARVSGMPLADDAGAIASTQAPARADPAGGPVAHPASAGRPPLSHVRVRSKSLSLIEHALLATIGALFVAGVMLMNDALSKKQDYLQDVERVGHDQEYQALAGKAGYRIEIQDGPQARAIVARCVRSDLTGPVACDPAPRPQGLVGERMLVVNGEAKPLRTGGRGSDYLCPGMC